MAADKVLTELAKRYIETLPAVRKICSFDYNEIFFLQRVRLNYQKILFVHH
jgi:hypothetical protein